MWAMQGCKAVFLAHTAGEEKVMLDINKRFTSVAEVSGIDSCSLCKDQLQKLPLNKYFNTHRLLVRTFL